MCTCTPPPEMCETAGPFQSLRDTEGSIRLLWSSMSEGDYTGIDAPQ